MTHLELLAPARNLQIGIAAIDCGADAVYIAGPGFGARHSAGNSIDDIRELCSYAHRFGVRIFVTVNTILFDDELKEAGDMMEELAKAGADAFIVQDLAVAALAKERGIGIPLHAST
ncbi:MAG: U32 family peptidase, partial [Bacteroidales bacterium]|nr:U32 family peptidase [Bacteroidales bacterium]